MSKCITCEVKRAKVLTTEQSKRIYGARGRFSGYELRKSAVAGSDQAIFCSQRCAAEWAVKAYSQVEQLVETPTPMQLPDVPVAECSTDEAGIFELGHGQAADYYRARLRQMLGHQELELGPCPYCDADVRGTVMRPVAPIGGTLRWRGSCGSCDGVLILEHAVALGSDGWGWYQGLAK